MNSWKLDKKIRRLLMKLIEERRHNLVNEESSNGVKDLLGLMLRANFKEQIMAPGDQARIFKHNDIIEECKTFFFAGKETTSSLLTWTTVLLAMHPHWQTLAQEEIFKVCGSERTPSKDDLPKLKLVKII